MTQSTSSPLMPLVILGGRDRESTTLPEGGRDKKVLRGYKAVDLEIGGRRLIEILVGRVRDSGAFDPIYIAGPSKVYEPFVDGVHFIETDSSIGDNLAACIQTMLTKHPGQQCMFTTCDILPERDELALALEDFRRHQPMDFWMAQIRVPDDLSQLGESAWKPKYMMHPTGEAGPVRVLPSHVIAVDPQIADTDLILRFFAGLYSTRNRPISARYAVIARQVLLKLFLDDLRNWIRLRWSHRLATVVVNCLITARKLAAGVANQAELEDRMRRIFIRPEHIRTSPQSRSRVAIIEGLSLAKDIDTEEEAQEMARKTEASEAAPHQP